MTAAYRNFGHYVTEAWPAEPKETFLAVADLLRAAGAPPNAKLLDVGCATGELIAYLGGEFPGWSFTGIDVFDELVAEATRRVPRARFMKASALSLPEEATSEYDLVTALGVLSIFDELEMKELFENLVRATRPRGRILVLAPLNEYGVDVIVRHRKRIDGAPGPWESGWNVHSRESVAEALRGRVSEWRLHDFRLSLDLEPRPDPVRTWTMRTESNGRQLTNGLKLLLDLYFIEIVR